MNFIPVTAVVPLDIMSTVSMEEMIKTGIEIAYVGLKEEVSKQFPRLSTFGIKIKASSCPLNKLHCNFDWEDELRSSIEPTIDNPNRAKNKAINTGAENEYSWFDLTWETFNRKVIIWRTWNGAHSY